MHISVLKERIIELLDPKPNQNFIDATVGRGGHLKAILQKNGPKGKVLGIDWDPVALQNAQSELTPDEKKRTVLVNENFANLKEVVEKEKFSKVSGIILDLGLSSDQLEEDNRGFSFKRDEILDMRFNPNHGLDAKKILNFWSRMDIERILKEYGEERFAPLIAREIVHQRSQSPIVKTGELVEVVQRATPAWYRKGKIHPATKTFQALRIAVNHELENIQKVLPEAVDILEKGGKLLVISFHSLEDRIVKQFSRNTPGVQLLTKKPITPDFKEVKQNPRSRSAKLRAVVKI